MSIRSNSLSTPLLPAVVGVLLSPLVGEVTVEVVGVERIVGIRLVPLGTLRQ